MGMIVTPNGTRLTITERAGGIGSIDDFFKEVEEVRRQYGHILNKQSLDEYFAERHMEAEQECG